VHGLESLHRRRWGDLGEKLLPDAEGGWTPLLKSGIQQLAHALSRLVCPAASDRMQDLHT